jgi:hypothetical protein
METCELCQTEKPDVKPRFYDLTGGAGDGIRAAGTVNTCDNCDQDTHIFDSDALLRLDEILRVRSSA